MTATTHPARSYAGRALGRLATTEARLYLRDPASWFWSLAFPTVLLLALGLLMPWADEPWGEGDLAAFSMMTGYTPTVLTLATVTVALNLYPVTIAGYRQRGVLRRLSTTPVPPARLLLAQIVVQAAALVVAAGLAVVAGAAVLGISMPQRPVLVVLAFVLGALASFGIGSLVAALAPTAGAATGLGTTLMFLGMFFGGVWLPLPIMPDVLVTVSGYVPPGAATQAMTAAWLGQPVPTDSLLVLAAWALVTIPVAVRTFRWS